MSERALATTQKRSSAWVAPPGGRILQRKCACGNHAMAGGECAECKGKKGVLQRKLTIGATNDPLEHEADRIADQIGSPAQASAGASPRIQRFAGSPALGGDTAPVSVENVLAGHGAPLQPELRRDMEQKFAYDFSRVRVHTGDAAEQSARDVNAKAYTVGNHIVFGASQFAPANQDGRRLLAHELTHVVQQGAGTPFQAEPGTPKSFSPASAVKVGSVQRSASEDVLRRSVAGCQELLDNPGPPMPPAAGTFVHRALLAFFMATVPGAVRIFIPGASANPQRSGGGRTIPPEKISPSLRSGKGTPDLATLNSAGVLQVAELKPANWNQLLEGETQVARYIDQGMASDEPQKAWRLSKGITSVTPMLEQTFPVSSLFFPTPANIIEVVFRWCQSGVLAYALRAHRRPDAQRVPVRRRVPDRVTETDKQREQVPQTVPLPDAVGNPSPAPTPVPAPTPPTPTPVPTPKPDDGGKIIKFPGSKTPDTKPEELPAAAKTMAEQILEFIEGIIVSGENVEQAVRRFLQANPNIVRNIEIVVAAIVAGAVISDILSAGGAIAKDPAVAAILAAMLRIAQAIRVAAPVLVP
jgi:hypothetical protein